MKRVLVVVLATVSVLGATFVADAVKPKRLAEDAVAVQDAWTAWALGSSTDPLLQEADDFCGEVVDGQFFLTAAISPGRTERTCMVPAGMEIVSVGAGSFRYKGAAHETDSELFRGNMKDLKPINLDSVKVKVDGALVPRGSLVCPPSTDIDLEPGNLLQEIDPAVTGDSARVSSCAWMYVLAPLSVGSHTLFESTKWKGEKRYENLFSVTVA